MQKKDLKPLNKTQRKNLQKCVDYLKTPGVKLGRNSYEKKDEDGNDVPNCAVGHFAINVFKQRPGKFADNALKVLGVDSYAIERRNDFASNARRKRSMIEFLEWHLTNR